MGGINHQPSVFAEFIRYFRDGLCIPVRAMRATSQNDVAVWISCCLYHRRLSIVRGAKEEMWGGSGRRRMNRHIYIAVGTIFKANGHGHPRCKMAVTVGFSSACNDCAPSHRLSVAV